MTEQPAPTILDYAPKARRVDALRLVFLVLALPSLALPFVGCWFGEVPWEFMWDTRPVLFFKGAVYLIVYPLLAWKIWLVLCPRPPRWAGALGYAVAALFAGFALTCAIGVLATGVSQKVLLGFILVLESLFVIPALIVGFVLMVVLARRTKAHAFAGEAAMLWVLGVAALPGALVTTGNTGMLGSILIWWTLGVFAADLAVLVVRAWRLRPRRGSNEGVIAGREK